MEAAIDEVLKAGLLAPFLVLTGWYILKQDERIKEIAAALEAVNKKRVEDAQTYGQSLVQMTKDHNEAFGKVNETLIQVREWMRRDER